MNRGKEATGLIFNLVQGSFVDGYGIRTTVFLKGCPLRCKWCCNPEGQSFQPQLRYLASHCNGCGRCIELCPKGALSIPDGKAIIDWNQCNQCGACVDACWFGALEQWGKVYTAEEIFEIVRRDAPYYEASGGGLTIGGGEATCYPEFCLALMDLCHDAGIQVAIDSCGYVTSDLGMEVLLRADLVLLDIKGCDSARHRVNTGVENSVIWDTLHRLNEAGQHIIIRIPVIPDCNEDELELIAQRLKPFSRIERVDLIAYHTFGSSKYEEIGLTYSLQAKQATAEQQNMWLQRFKHYGFQVQLGG